jgi:acyl carrier protein
MAGLIGGKQITIVHFVPSMLQVFEEVLESDAGLRKKVESIRYLFCSGEALGLAQVRKAHTLLPNAAVHNLYGPTEASIDVLSYDCSAKDIAAVLIGRPISNTAVYVLDGNNKPLPAGAAGELFIGGVGVARGYVSQPELTAERFISNPFQTEEERRSGVNSRLYRTGDLVRYLADGNLEYIGRNDSQVKIRGYRIELGEIEAAISSYEKVEQSVVVAKERIPGTKHLVGYYVSKRELDENELREYLIEHLPDYMVPTLLVHMERLPMTVNGKVDKKKLPDSWPATTDTHDHPRNETEEKLSLFFGELLGLAGSKAGVNDDFFRLGGDSILALRLVAAIRREYSSEVPLEVIFSKRTIAKISAYLSGGDGNKLFPTITKVKHSLEIPLSLSQEEMISHTAVEKNASNADFILKIKGPLNVEILEQTFVKMVERHEILRTVLKGARANGENNQYFQEIMPFENWSMNYLHRSAFENDAGIVKYVENYIRFPFDLSNEYSIRVALVDHANGEFLLVVVFSEMAVDGWSISLLQRDLMEIYNSKLKGIEESVEETPVSYADFSLWQDKYLRGVVLDEQLQYWRGQLKNIRPLDLRTDHPRIPLTEAKAGRVFRNIEQSIAVEIAPFTLQHNQTKFTILMTAFNILLYKWSGQSDICVGTTIANRRMQELESVVGYFANKIIIRSYVDESLTFIEMANQTKEAFFNGLANQDIRLSEVQDSLNPAHDPTRNSTYQSHFSYENYPQQRNFHLSDVVIERDARFIAPPVHYDILMYAANPVKEFYSIVIDYNSSLFELTTISKMLDDYMKILGWALHSSSKLKEFLSE